LKNIYQFHASERFKEAICQPLQAIASIKCIVLAASFLIARGRALFFRWSDFADGHWFFSVSGRSSVVMVLLAMVAENLWLVSTQIKVAGLGQMMMLVLVRSCVVLVMSQMSVNFCCLLFEKCIRKGSATLSLLFKLIDAERMLSRF